MNNIDHIRDATEKVFDVNATPVSDKAYNGDLSIGLRPEIATLKNSEELSRRLERALRKAVKAIDYLEIEPECWLKWALEDEK